MTAPRHSKVPRPKTDSWRGPIPNDALPATPRRIGHPCREHRPNLLAVPRSESFLSGVGGAADINQANGIRFEAMTDDAAVAVGNAIAAAVSNRLPYDRNLMIYAPGWHSACQGFSKATPRRLVARPASDSCRDSPRQNGIARLISPLSGGGAVWHTPRAGILVKPAERDL
jgi:hypothetical protein